VKKKSVGLVATQYRTLKQPTGGLLLQKGGSLPEVTVAYESYGKINHEKSNVILLCHALTGDAHAAGYHSLEDKKAGWWDIMIGPGKAIDTDYFFVICTNILGGCKGTTGPSSVNPITGKPYGSDFPSITVYDMIHVQKIFLDELSIPSLFGIIGGSAGGFQVLEWCVQYPDFIQNAVVIASAESLCAQALSFDIVARNIILADPEWQGGHYYGSGREPSKGLSLARMIGHISYLSSETMDIKFGRERRAENGQNGLFSTDFEIESYLNYQGKIFTERFDANSFLYITQAMDWFSLKERDIPLNKLFEKKNISFLLISVSSDWLYPAKQAKNLAELILRANNRVSYCDLSAPHGHDSFLIENETLSEIVSSFFNPELGKKHSVSEHDCPRCETFSIIKNMLTPKSRVLDLGCGDGSFLSRIMAESAAHVHGFDIDINKIIACNLKKIPAFQIDLDEGLGMIPDMFYDFAVLNQTLLEVFKPQLVLMEMMRIARYGIVSFANYANWKHRIKLGLFGRLPLSRELPFEWYNTPNIHFLSLRDFKNFCRRENIIIHEQHFFAKGVISKILSALGFANLGADRVIVKISASTQSTSAE